jgi:phage tail protein X
VLKKVLVLVVVLSFVVGLTGCSVRTYKITHDRVDQDLTVGNKGYLKGTPPPETGERKLTRDTQAVEIELGFPAKGKKPSAKKGPAAPCGPKIAVEEPIISPIEEPILAETQQYKVQKGDTLQKISQKFYGTTKKWQKIYEANKGALKAPDKIYPGQTINIPVEPMKEPAGNLK